MISDRLSKIQTKKCFNNVIIDDFIEIECEYLQTKYAGNSTFRLVSNVFKTTSNIEYCLDINYAHLNYLAKFYYNLYVSDIFLDEFKNKKSGILVYDINFNQHNFIINDDNEIYNVNDLEKSEIMGKISFILNEYIKQFPDRKIYGINLKNHTKMLDLYVNVFRKIFPNNFHKFNLSNCILFIDESILKDNFKKE